MTTDTKKSKRLTLHDKDTILKHYQDGLNGKEISAITGLAHWTITRYLKIVKSRRGGIAAEEKRLHKEAKPKEYTRNPVTNEQTEKMLELWNKGMRKYTDIAQKVGCSDATVHKYLKPMIADQLAKTPKKPKTGTLSEILSAPATTDIDRQIMKAELKLEILKEMKAGR